MKLSKKEELLALGSALYLLGIEMEASRSKLEALVARSEADDADIPITDELIEEVKSYKSMNERFISLEKRYLQLKKELE